jgi:putative Holliday junction resolvase
MPSLQNRGLKDLIANLRATIQSMDIRELVMGIPFNMDGSRGDAVIQMEQLLETLKAKLGLPLYGVDERLSTVEAAEFWHDMNQKQKKKYRTVDSLAAAMILDRYLKEI